MKKYLIDYVEVSEKEFYNELEDAVRNEVENYYDEMLDECYETVKIGNIEFTPSEILFNCDPIAYKCGLNDYVDSQLSDAIYELEKGRNVDFNCTYFEIEETEEE